MLPKYKTIVVDPPWEYKGKPAKSSKYSKGQMFNKTVTGDYKGTMTVDIVKSFDVVSKLADKDCIVLLWSVNRHLHDCPEIIRSWGFDIKRNGGNTMCWNKTGGCAKSPKCFYSNAEFVVVGKKGDIQWKTTKGLKACFTAKNEGHSVKPAEFYRMIRECTHAPRVDIFARRRHDGFDAWGNQVEIRENDLVSNYPPQKVIQLGTGELHMDLCN